MTNLYDFTATTLSGQPADLSEYKGKVVLVVNTASKCGFTPQFEGLQGLYDDFGTNGLEILGFPCDQFANQELDSADEIGEFCHKNYGVSFPMFEKVDVNGKEAHPLWKWLRSEKSGLGGSAIKWNFTKFLLDTEGKVVKRYAPTTKPEALRKDIEKLLGS